MKLKLITPLLIISLLALLQGCAGNRTVSEGDLLYSVMNTISFPDGDKYVGELNNGLPHGNGTYTYSNGDKYIGVWNNGKYNGKGTYTHSDGRKYVGEFKDNMKHGKGASISFGNVYIGEWHTNKKNGKGIMTILKDSEGFEKGTVYVGSFKNGFLNGQCTITYPDGEISKGKWVKGKFIDK